MYDIFSQGISWGKFMLKFTKIIDSNAYLLYNMIIDHFYSKGYEVQ